MKQLFTPFASSASFSAFIVRHLMLVVSFSFASVTVHAQLELLKDVDSHEELTFNEYSWFTVAGNYMYFVSNNELWKSNGTTQYTVKMKSFTSVSNLTMVGSTLYFAADDGTSGTELWKSNGAPGSTVRVKDIVPGATGSSPTYLTSVGGVLFFAATTEGNGTELWKSNGTAAGTNLVKDISRGSSNPRNLVDFNGTLFFAATSPTGYELWKSDGTSANTVLVKDIFEGTRSSNPSLLTVSNDKLFFTAQHPDTGIEVWLTDGTPGGTQLLRDIKPGTQTSAPENLIHANGKLMFTANDGIHGDELWTSSGTTSTTNLVKDMNPGPAGSNTTDPFLAPMGHFTNINGLLYFIASKGTHDYIYRSDGTEAGTVIITEAFGININEPQPEFTYRAGYVYFFNGQLEDNYIYTLCKMPYNGQGITGLKRFEGNTEDYYAQVDNQMVAVNGAVLFPARFYDAYTGYELIRSDGTWDGTVSVHDTFAPTMSSDPREMISLNGRVYSLHYSYLSYSPELYSTDGTPEGTFEIRPGRIHYEWAPVGNDLYFVEDDFATYDNRWQLSKTKGTPATTSVIATGAPWQEDTHPTGLTDVNGTLYFFNSLGEVWRSNGTAAGTEMIKDLYKVISITDVNGQAFVLAENNINQIVLLKTNSTGTLDQVTALNGTADFEAGNIKHQISVGGIFYFLADADGGVQIWRSDGTGSGTYKMFGPGGFQGGTFVPQYSAVILLEFNDELYFSDESHLYKVVGDTYSKIADVPPIQQYVSFNERIYLFTGGYDQKIYVSDGSPAGTILLLSRRINNSYYTDHAIVGEYLYFNSISSEELWRTDGTACGTSVVDVGATEPYALEGIGNDLVFGGTTLKTGTELFVYHNVNSIQGPACDNMSAQVANEPVLTSYPNPFTESFSLQGSADGAASADVSVYTSEGMPVERLQNVRLNGEQLIGKGWTPGSYILKIQTKETLSTYHVIKN